MGEVLALQTWESEAGLPSTHVESQAWWHKPKKPLLGAEVEDPWAYQPAVWPTDELQFHERLSQEIKSRAQRKTPAIALSVCVFVGIQINHTHHTHPHTAHTNTNKKKTLCKFLHMQLFLFLSCFSVYFQWYVRKLEQQPQNPCILTWLFAHSWRSRDMSESGSVLVNKSTVSSPTELRNPPTPALPLLRSQDPSSLHQPESL